MAAFIAQIGHESGQLTRMVESLNYSADRLQAVWPNHFDAALAAKVARQPEQIANIVYAGRIGNTLPGDGWKYRGRGLIQLTGANNYRAAGTALGLDLVNHPELVERPDTAAKIIRTINGGLTGQAERVALCDLAVRVLA